MGVIRESIRGLRETINQNPLIKRTFVALTKAKLVVLPSQMLSIALLSKFLGVEGYGIFSAIAAVGAICSTLSSFFGRNVVYRALAKSNISANVIWGTNRKALLISNLLLCPIVYIAASLFLSNITFHLIFSAFIFNQLYSFSLRHMQLGICQALGKTEEMLRIELAYVLPRVVLIAATMLFTPEGLDLHERLRIWAYLQIVCDACFLTASNRILRRSFGKPRFDMNVLKDNLIVGASWTVSNFGSQILRQGPRAIIARVWGPELAGLYFLCMQIAEVVTLHSSNLLLGSFASKFLSFSKAASLGDFVRNFSKVFVPVMLFSVVLNFLTYWTVALIQPYFKSLEDRSELVDVLGVVLVAVLARLAYIQMGNFTSFYKLEKFRFLINFLIIFPAGISLPWIAASYSWEAIVWFSAAAELVGGIALMGVILFASRRADSRRQLS